MEEDIRKLAGCDLARSRQKDDKKEQLFGNMSLELLLHIICTYIFSGC